MSIYEDVRELSKRFVEPFSKEIDEERRFPVEAFKALGDAGYFKLIIPEELGGLGKGIIEHQEVVLALSESCPTVGLCYMMHNVALNCVLSKGSEKLRKDICRDIVENKVFMALAYSEFGTGTHFYKPEISVEEKDGKFIFNGTKSMVTSAEHASYYLILSQSTENKDNINNWVVPKDTEGVEFITKHWDGVGMRGNMSCPMKLTDVKLDKYYRIGEEGSGMSQVFEQVAPMFIVGLASVYSGLTIMQSKLATEYAIKRTYPDGQSLSNIETVQIHLAKIYTLAQTSRVLTIDSAKALDRGDEDALAKILAARINASENAIEASRLAMRIGGGKTYNKMSQIERLMRDSYAGQIMAPSVDVLIVWLGKALTGQPLI